MRHLITILCSLCILSGSAAHAAPKPNIVVLVSDDAGYNEFSMHGAKHFPTPRIDSIAANAMRCAQGYTSGTVCSSTRAGLLTSRYQNRFAMSLTFRRPTANPPASPPNAPKTSRG